MRMNQDERRFDFHGLGLAIKQAREERGWTQAYLAELVGKTDRTIMSIENKGQHPSLQIFFELTLRYNISVDQFHFFSAYIVPFHDNFCGWVLSGGSMLCIAVFAHKSAPLQ